MSTDRANWDDTTVRTFLELVIEQKNLLHWNQRGLTALGWANLYPAFTTATGLTYEKKQLQNKLNELKRAYFTWRDFQSHTDIGRDPHTGGVTVDPSFFEGGNGVLIPPICFITPLLTSGRDVPILFNSNPWIHGTRAGK